MDRCCRTCIRSGWCLSPVHVALKLWISSKLKKIYWKLLVFSLFTLKNLQKNRCFRAKIRKIPFAWFFRAWHLLLRSIDQYNALKPLFNNSPQSTSYREYKMQTISFKWLPKWLLLSRSQPATWKSEKFQLGFNKNASTTIQNKLWCWSYASNMFLIGNRIASVAPTL